MTEKSSYQIAAEALLSEGGVRYKAGETIPLSGGSTITVLSGWAVALGNRVVCVGKLSEVTRPDS